MHAPGRARFSLRHRKPPAAPEHEASRWPARVLIAATGVVGTAAECRERLAAYRHSGIALPIISPFSRGPQGKQRAIEAIKACAP